ncbi:MAG: hypothetical protein LBK82_11225 [Planctomycetaceae bacterium]|jgi:hypothetical protein|nr:hypothetical protein [Planctomycetaceae bacterium]
MLQKRIDVVLCVNVHFLFSFNGCFSFFYKEETMESSTNLTRGIRYNSETKFWGMPFISIAMGPDTEKNEVRGHAKGIIAIGDIATGGLAIGGIARGVVATGGVSVGIIALGGLSIGIVALGGLAMGLIALGGLAIALCMALGGGAIAPIAIGGCAIGFVSIGGLAIGYYAHGGVALGVHVISATVRSPEAVDFFRNYFGIM